jgi:hypothetical protein
MQYRLVNSVLFHVNYDLVVLRCIKCEYDEKDLRELNDGLAGGHFA